jgi:hypothetical protein
MIYSRPNLFPGEVVSYPNLSATPSYAVSGNRAKLLDWLTNLNGIQITVSWSAAWRYPPNPTVVNSTYNQTFSTANPNVAPWVGPAACSYGYFYPQANQATILYPDAASRILGPLDGAKPLPSFSVSNPTVGLTCEFRPSFDGANYGIAFFVTAVDITQAVNTSQNPGFPTLTIASTVFSIDGMNFTTYLLAPGAPPIAVDAATFAVYGTRL